MAEGEDENLVAQVVAELCAVIEQVSVPALAAD